MKALSAHSVFREVVVTKLRAGRSGRVVQGWLVAPITVGRRLIVREPGDRQMTSTKIRRLLVEDLDSRVAYVETQNSSYRIQFVSSEKGKGDSGVQVDYDVDSREITLMEALPRRSG